MPKKIIDTLKKFPEKFGMNTINVVGFAIFFVAVVVLNFNLFINMTTGQTEEVGRLQMQSVCFELENFVKPSEAYTKQIAAGIEQRMAAGASRDEIFDFVWEETKDTRILADDPTFCVYAAGPDWHAVPEVPDDYNPTDRIWYQTAIANPGKANFTEPYTDIVTNEAFITLSLTLPDSKTVVASDYSLSQLNKFLSVITENSEAKILVTTGKGNIIAYRSGNFLGKNISEVLPEYEKIFQQLSTSDNGDITLNSTGYFQTVLTAKTSNDWCIILVEDNLAFYNQIYWQMMITGSINVMLILFIAFIYFNSIRRRVRAENAQTEGAKFFIGVSDDVNFKMTEILRLIQNADEKKSDGKISEIKREVEKIHDELNKVADGLKVAALNPVEQVAEQEITEDLKLSKTGRRVRLQIISVLCVAMIFTLALGVQTAISRGNSQINREIDRYENVLTNFIDGNKTIFRIMATEVAEHADALENGSPENVVAFLRELKKNYPEIFVAYVANPYKENQILVSNDWRPKRGWRVADEPWYKNTDKTDGAISISNPYYNELNGRYCISLTTAIYKRSGEFVGIFGADFYLDRLLSAMSGSYSTNAGGSAWNQYVFIADKNGGLLNHPNPKYKLSVTNITDIKDTEYRSLYDSFEPEYLKNYEGVHIVAGAKKNNATGFSVVAVERWSSVYGVNIILLSTAIILLFGIGMVAVQYLMNQLFRWQDDVNLKLRESADKAIAAGLAKSKFLAQMSHEIRTPINAVIGMNEMILRESTEPAIKKYAADVASGSENLLSLINDILDFSKIESGKMELVPTNYEIGSLLNDLVNMIEPRAKKKNLKFNVEVDPNIPTEFYGDVVRIRQIITNFLTNAVKYTPNGQVDFIVTGEKTGDDEFNLCVHVKDTGIGLKTQDKEKLFDDFSRFDSVKNQNIEGTGLGLAITRKLVEQMGGKIEVESVYGEGSTFTVTLPQKIINPDPLGDYAEFLKNSYREREKYQAEFTAPNAEILVVDDNETNLVVVRGLLKQTKIKITTVLSGTECLEEITKKHYDIIFLDHMMPEPDGVETLHRAKNLENNLCKNSPCIILTANAISGAREMFMKEGFDDYISKPIDAHKLETMLIKYLPEEKVIIAGENSDEEPEKIPQPEENSGGVKNHKGLIDVELGLQYSAEMIEIYQDVLQTYCTLGEEKRREIIDTFDAEDWKNYTVYVHSLKSTSMTIGAAELSDLAKKLEDAGRSYTTENNTDALNFIRANHEKLLQLHEKVVAEGFGILKEIDTESGEEENFESEKISQPDKIEEPEKNSVGIENHKGLIDVETGLQYSAEMIEIYRDVLQTYCTSGEEKRAELAESFGAEDWKNYSAQVRSLQSESMTIGAGELSDLAKKIESAAKKSATENDTDALNFIRANHEKLLQLHEKVVAEGFEILKRIEI